MSALQKIFAPSSLKKKSSSQPLDGAEAEKSISRASTSRQVRVKPLDAEVGDDDDDAALARSVSMTLNCDPVPSSFKTNGSLVNGSRPAMGTGSPRSLRANASFSNSGTHLDRHHQHNAALGSSIGRHNRHSLFDKPAAQTNSSFAPGGDLNVPGGIGSKSTGNVNLWRLPWTQQRVVMCPNCHRPRKAERPGNYVSRADYAVPEAGASPNVGDDMSEASDNLSCGGSEGSGGPLTASVTYCRCGVAMEGSPVMGASPAAEEYPPVFLVETEKSSKMVLPGTIADDADSEEAEEGEVEGMQRTYRLSLVSPLTTTTLRRQQSVSTAPSLHQMSREASSAASAPKVDSWLKDQQTSSRKSVPAPKVKATR